MDKSLQDKLLVKDKWIRVLFMILFFICKYIVQWLIVIIAIFQFFYDLITGKLHEKILDFSATLNIYLLSLANYLTFNSDEKPFPIGPWPKK